MSKIIIACDSQNNHYYDGAPSDHIGGAYYVGYKGTKTTATLREGTTYKFKSVVNGDITCPVALVTKGNTISRVFTASGDEQEVSITIGVDETAIYVNNSEGELVEIYYDLEADFAPSNGNFSPNQPFRFWCQTVLPLVYDDSLSYYELLNKVVRYINSIIGDVTELENQNVKVINAYNELQNYVNTYFANLDISGEVDRKLDEMAQDGTFDELVREALDHVDYVNVIEEEVDEQLPSVVGHALDEWVNVNPTNIIGDYKAIKQYPLANGWIGTTTGENPNWGKWYISGTSNKHIVIPVKNGDIIGITYSNAYQHGYCAVFKSYSTPVNGATPDYSSISGWTTLVEETGGITKKYTMPSDAQYFYLAAMRSNTNILPINIELNGKLLNFNSSVESGVQYAKQETTNMFIGDENVFPVKWEAGAITEPSVGDYLKNSDTQTTRSARKRISFPITAPSDLLITCDGDYLYRIFILNEDLSFKEFGYDGWKNVPYVAPKGTIFRIIVGARSDVNHVSTADISNVDISKHLKIHFGLSDFNWCAMGDSITEGWASTAQHTSEENNGAGWVSILSGINKWKITNIAEGGTGFLCPKSQQNPTTGYSIATATDFTQFDLVTIAYGINDWKANLEMGSINDPTPVSTPTTVLGAMKATIERIFTSNKNCKIIGILPLNCRGYEFTYGDEEHNYGLGYTFSNSGTLESFVQALKSVYDYYGIETIDMTHYSCVNRKTLPTLLPDGVHPSKECNKLLAYELSKKISF